MSAEPSAFEQLFLPHLEAAYNLARWIVQRDQDAQDVVQEAYIRALKGFPGFRGDNARAWLLTIVRNTAYSWLRQQARFSNLLPFDPSIHAQPLEEPPSESTHEERVQRLHEALQQLPAPMREVLVLYELEGWSYQQLASGLKVPLGTVMSRLSRARRRLQTALAWPAQGCCGQRTQHIRELNQTRPVAFPCH
jgi:RNA polymerase sigma-70 factor (ECF subfamily)